MNCKSVVNQIVSWLKDYSDKSHTDGYVVGVSGGVDSAVVSTLCAMTGLNTLVVSLPIKPIAHRLEQRNRAENHCTWLSTKFSNLDYAHRDLTKISESFGDIMDAPECSGDQRTSLAVANMKSRLRMVALYFLANYHNYLVVGTGNKVEDYGVGFFTKYGDGGVDISPIGDLMKTEVWELAKYLGINQEIIEAKPTDGLWDDGRTDEDQIGASYADLEKAMKFCEEWYVKNQNDVEHYKLNGKAHEITPEFEAVLNIYLQRHETSRHKMEMPPICQVTKE